MQNTRVFPHDHRAAFLIRDGAGHIADQGQLTSKLMTAVTLHHQLDDLRHAAFPVPVEHTAQGRTKTGINFCIQVVDPLRKLAETFLCIFHSLFSSL